MRSLVKWLKFGHLLEGKSPLTGFLANLTQEQSVMSFFQLDAFIGHKQLPTR